MNTERSLWLAKGFYFLFFAGIGAIAPFFNIYLERQGLSGLQIGLLGSISPLISLFANPLWGALVDRWQAQRLVLIGCAIISGVIMPLFLITNSFWWLLLLNIALVFFRSPLPAISDSVVINLVQQANSTYGRQRLWGSIGFILTSYGLALFVSVDDLRPIFWLHAVLFAVFLAIVGGLLPVERTGRRVQFLKGLQTLAHQPGYLGFLGTVILYGAGQACYLNFLGNHILALGGNGGQIGLAFAGNALAEIPMMYVGGQIVARYGNQRIILISILSVAATWLLMALAQTPLPILGLTLLIGIGYGALWPAMVGHANEMAPEGMSATAQSIVGAVNIGLGWGIGSLLAGQIWDLFGGQMLFVTATLLATSAAAIFWWTNRKLAGELATRTT